MRSGTMNDMNEHGEWISERTDKGMERSVMERDVREERERDPIGSRDLDAGYEQAWR